MWLVLSEKGKRKWGSEREDEGGMGCEGVRSVPVSTVEPEPDLSPPKSDPTQPTTRPFSNPVHQATDQLVSTCLPLPLPTTTPSSAVSAPLSPSCTCLRASPPRLTPILSSLFLLVQSSPPA